MRLKLDERNVRELPLSLTKQTSYFDTKTPGLHVKVGKKTKTFCLQRAVKNRLTLVTIGRYPEFNVAKARIEAEKLAVLMKSGVNPNEERKALKRKTSQTLDKVFESYRKVLKDREKLTAYNEYKAILDRHFKDWLKKEIDFVTRDKVENRHRKIAEKSGKKIANKAFRILRAIYNYHAIDNPDFKNPVYVLSQKKLWCKEPPSTRHLETPDEFKRWHQAVLKQNNKNIAAYLTFVLLNGLRKSEAMKLKWSDVNFESKTFVIKETKNGKSLELPISKPSVKLLKQQKVCAINEWVFPSETSKSGHIVEPKKVLANVRKLSGLEISTHDLRRTFLTVASGLNISQYTLKRIANHSTKNDVTSVYAIPGAEDLRVAMEMIADRVNERIKGKKE
ncbi:MAG: integrase family protein [Rickettsiales bacterium]|nr:integrase family protein [Rickettsiales bacterium]